MISKNIFNMVKNNIQYYLNPNQYFYCNYMFKSKFPKFIFESLSIERTIASKYIVFNTNDSNLVENRSNKVDFY